MGHTVLHSSIIAGRQLQIIQMSVVVFTKIVCEKKKKKDNELDRAHSVVCASL